MSTEKGCGVKNGTCTFPGAARGYLHGLPGRDWKRSVPVRTPVMCVDVWMHMHMYENHSASVKKAYSNNCACELTFLIHNLGLSVVLLILILSL